MLNELCVLKKILRFFSRLCSSQGPDFSGLPNRFGLFQSRFVFSSCKFLLFLNVVLFLSTTDDDFDPDSLVGLLDSIALFLSACCLNGKVQQLCSWSRKEWMTLFPNESAHNTRPHFVLFRMTLAVEWPVKHTLDYWFSFLKKRKRCHCGGVTRN